MDTVADFLIGLLFYDTGLFAVAYMIYRFVGGKGTDPKQPIKLREKRHIHWGKWA